MTDDTLACSVPRCSSVMLLSPATPSSSVCLPLAPSIFFLVDAFYFLLFYSTFISLLLPLFMLSFSCCCAVTPGLPLFFFAIDRFLPCYFLSSFSSAPFVYSFFCLFLLFFSCQYLLLLLSGYFFVICLILFGSALFFFRTVFVLVFFPSVTYQLLALPLLFSKI